MVYAPYAEGADVDGDKLKVIWDERITRNFKPWPLEVYPQPEMHPLGSMKIRDIEPDEVCHHGPLHLVPIRSV